MHEIAESRMSNAFGEDSEPGLRKWAEEMIAAIDLASYQAQSVAAFEFDVRDRLPELQLPVHVIHGEKDRSLPLILAQGPPTRASPRRSSTSSRAWVIFRISRNRRHSMTGSVQLSRFWIV